MVAHTHRCRTEQEGEEFEAASRRKEDERAIAVPSLTGSTGSLTSRDDPYKKFYYKVCIVLFDSV